MQSERVGKQANVMTSYRFRCPILCRRHRGRGSGYRCHWYTAAGVVSLKLSQPTRGRL